MKIRSLEEKLEKAEEQVRNEHEENVKIRKQVDVADGLTSKIVAVLRKSEECVRLASSSGSGSNGAGEGLKRRDQFLLEGVRRLVSIENELRHELERLRTGGDHVQEFVDSLQRDINKVRMEHQRAQERVHEISDTCEMQAKEIEELNEMCNSLESERDETRRQLAIHAQSAEESGLELQEVLKENGKLRGELSGKQKKVESLSKKDSGCEEEISSMQKMIDDLSSKLEKSRYDLHSALEKKTATERRFQRIRDDHTGCGEKISDLQKGVDEWKQKCEKMDALVQTERDRCASHQRNVMHLTQELEALHEMGQHQRSYGDTAIKKSSLALIELQDALMIERANKSDLQSKYDKLKSDYDEVEVLAKQFSSESMRLQEEYATITPLKPHPP
jgi:chromosome segregation ATPase